jgi:hypothetical protein
LVAVGVDLLLLAFWLRLMRFFSSLRCLGGWMEEVLDLYSKLHVTVVHVVVLLVEPIYGESRV